MTARELYDATLIELNKLNSPTFGLDQWLYFANKAIQSYTDQRYNFYAMNQQLTDDLRVLLSVYRAFNPDLTQVDSGATVIGWDESGSLPSYTNSVWVSDYNPFAVGSQIMFGDITIVYTITEILQDSPAIGQGILKITPKHYLSGGDIDPTGSITQEQTIILVGDKVYTVDSTFDIGESMSDNTIFSFNLDPGNYYHMLAIRTYWSDSRMSDALTDSDCDYAAIKSLSNMYPAKRLTYDMLANIENNSYLKPMYRQPYYQLHDHYLNLGTEKVDQVTTQYQNTPHIEVHAGKVPKGFSLQMIEVDYLKLPEIILLTEDEVYQEVDDKSQLLEWPDYLNSDIIKQIVSYFIENEFNPRLQSFTSLQADTPAVPLEAGEQQQ